MGIYLSTYQEKWTLPCKVNKTIQSNDDHVSMDFKTAQNKCLNKFQFVSVLKSFNPILVCTNQISFHLI